MLYIDEEDLYTYENKEFGEKYNGMYREGKTSPSLPEGEVTPPNLPKGEEGLRAEKEYNNNNQ